MFACVWMVFSTRDRDVCVWMVFSIKDMNVCLCVDGVQHQGQHQGHVCLPVCGWFSAPGTGGFACVWMVFPVPGTEMFVCGWCSVPGTDMFACVWKVFSTRDRYVCLCVDGVQHQGQHQGQACLPVCGWCSAPGTAPGTGMFACVWMVFSTKDTDVCLCVDGVQHQGQCSAPGTGVFACVWMMFSTRDRYVCLCVDGVQNQGQVCLPVCGWFSLYQGQKCLCVDGVQYQGQTCLPVCGRCSAPGTGMVLFALLSHIAKYSIPNTANP
ncbi:hypothetical protein Bbelb_141100 [Branchiostoma belcheri]|nr:hypothetical protein Bbelb_141100 [Branchiostoma belcheri]